MPGAPTQTRHHRVSLQSHSHGRDSRFAAPLPPGAWGVLPAPELRWDPPPPRPPRPQPSPPEESSSDCFPELAHPQRGRTAGGHPLSPRLQGSQASLTLRPGCLCHSGPRAHPTAPQPKGTHGRAAAACFPWKASSQATFVTRTPSSPGPAPRIPARRCGRAQLPIRAGSASPGDAGQLRSPRFLGPLGSAKPACPWPLCLLVSPLWKANTFNLRPKK